MQKQAVNLQHYGKPEALKKVEDKIASLEQELDEIPVVQEFKQSQLEVNDLLQLIATTVSNKVTDVIIEFYWRRCITGETGASMNNGGVLRKSRRLRSRPLIIGKPGLLRAWLFF